jgi:hypothetical protein
MKIIYVLGFFIVERICLMGDITGLYDECAMIVMRTGGLDGVALQSREYRYLLNSMDINVYTITGQSEDDSGSFDPIGHRSRGIARLSFFHKDSELLFANQFKEGAEKTMAPEIDDKEWLRLFKLHKDSIKTKIDRIIKKLPPKAPVFVFNLLSLRHAHPAASVAIRGLMEKYPGRNFISHSADPDAERPEKISRIKDFSLKIISANPADMEYSGGPYLHKNLFHIVLNPTQKGNFVEKYKIPRSRIFEIPDFLEFKSRTPQIRERAGLIFMDYLSDRALIESKNGFSYARRPVNKDMLFMLSPVRPVYRKRIKEAMLVSWLYSKARNLQVAYVVTHPNKDDVEYFQETVKFAHLLDLPYYHLGKDFSLQTLEDVYDNFAPLRTIGVVASSAGGWENALNEMARACIPFYMNKNLNSFKPLTEKIGIKTHGMDFLKINEIVSTHKVQELIGMDFSKDADLKETFSWFDTLLNASERKKIICHNYRKAYNYLSYKAVRPKLLRALRKIADLP